MKSNSIKRSTFRIALCGVISALSLIFMLATALVPIGTYAFPCIAGIFFISIVIEYKYKWAFMLYAVVSIMSLFFASDKEAVLYFIALFGHYPILKGIIEEKIKNKVVKYFIKLSVFNASAIGSFFIAIFLLGVPAEEFTIAGFYIPWAFLIFGNIFFLVYDYAISVFAFHYIRKIHSKLFKK